MSGTPSWLYYFLGVLMWSVAAYCLWEFVWSTSIHLRAGVDVEIAHIFMGIAMAGMFVPKWAFGPSAIWEIIFLALLIWFVVRSIQSVQSYGLHVPHQTIHAVMSFAMLLMYWFPGGSTAGVMSMSMSAHSARIDPGLAFVVAFILFGSAIFTIASPNRGATHFGTHGSMQDAGWDGAASTGAVRSAVAIQAVPDTRTTFALVGADATHVIMSVAMGFMLILMI